MADNALRVVITGAGSGLGQALSAKFIEGGAVVFGVGRKAEKLEQTARLVNSSDFHPYVLFIRQFYLKFLFPHFIFILHPFRDVLLKPDDLQANCCIYSKAPNTFLLSSFYCTVANHLAFKPLLLFGRTFGL